jgi:hypothetical protein
MNVLEQRRLPIHLLACTRCASPSEQGVPYAKVERMAFGGIGVQTRYRWACSSATGD